MTPLPFRIKICGVTTPEDAAAAIALGADALGVNFYAKSKRCVTSEDAAGIQTACSDTVQLVGVFVDSPVNEVSNASRTARLDWIQLHGDEAPATLKQIRTEQPHQTLRAFRWSEGAGDFVNEYLRQCSELECLPDAILIDSFQPGEFGGTGHVADWQAIARWRAELQWNVPLVLAGGLTPANVGEAIRTVRPDAVDTASGVEKSPRVKDVELMKQFVANAGNAFDVTS